MKNMEENKYKNPIMEHYEVDGQMNLSECMQAMQMQRKLTILKGALILREILGVRVNSKEETTRMAQKYTDAELSFWISFLREESHKAADIREKEAEERKTAKKLIDSGEAEIYMEGEPVSDKFEIEGIDINRYRVKVKGKKVYISR